MKKLVNLLKKPVVTAGVLGLVVASGAASATGDLKFYVGAGLDYTSYGLNKDVKDNFTSTKTKGMGLLAPVLGLKFHENFGVEAGYNFNKKIKLENNRGNLDIKVRNISLDLMGFMPVADQFELVGGLGLGRVSSKVTGTDNITGAAVGSTSLKAKTSLRAKLGAQYNSNTNVGVRALVAYQNVGNKDKNTDTKVIKNMKSIGLAATYTF